jgi:hypothetical protein
MMLVHANMPPKWYLAVAVGWEAHQRRWTRITPGPDALEQSFLEVLKNYFGDVSYPTLSYAALFHALCRFSLVQQHMLMSQTCFKLPAVRSTSFELLGLGTKSDRRIDH